MSQREISGFLSENHVAHLPTVRSDGRPHVTPISYIHDVENGRVFVMAPANGVKFRNVRQNPKVSLLIANDQSPYDYVVLEGEGRLTEDNMA
jgi:PPOX class probable F420-dependent enzyme